MANHIFILATVMLMAGIFGGLVNYYLQGDNDPDAASLPRCLVVGVGASFLVPVVLDFVNSELVLESQGDPSRLLIFTGFCLIAAIASRGLIVNISDRILNEAKNAREKSERMQHDLRIMQHELMPLIETETEQELMIDEEEVVNQGQEDILDVTSNKVLKILATGRYIFRSLPGLCHESNSDEQTMLQTLSVLCAKNLAGKVSGKKGVRWHITEKGRRTLEAQV